MVTQATRERLHVRWMIRRDVPEVLALEAGMRDEWSEKDLLKFLREQKAIAMVAERQTEGRILGFLLYELRKQSLFVERLNASWHDAEEVVGEFLTRLKAKLTAGRRWKIEIQTHEADLEAQLLLRANKFRATKVLRGHFGDADAYQFEYRLGWGD
jgi:[ribosomal protein S18]-alanine N-acetyltransferase